MQNDQTKDWIKLQSQVRKLMKRTLPLLIANAAETHFKNSFKNQGFTNRSFQPWRKTKSGKQNHFGRTGAGILVRSANLRDSITVRVAKNGVVYITAGNQNVPYAEIHNEGGTLDIPVTKKSRKYFWYMYKETDNEMYKYMALTKKKSFSITIPKRQFIGNISLHIPLKQGLKIYLRINFFNNRHKLIGLLRGE